MILLLLLLTTSAVLADRSVPEHLLSGMHNELPANYYKFLEVESNSSDGQYLAGMLTQDFMHSAQEAEKSGNLEKSFRLLALANHLFPYRGDVSSRLKKTAGLIVQKLNASTDCSDTYTFYYNMLRHYYQQMLQKVEPRCPDLTGSDSVPRDLVLEYENKLRSHEELVKKEIVTLLNKSSEWETISEKELVRNMFKAYLGHIRFIGSNVSQTEMGSLMVDMELIRKQAMLSFKTLASKYEERFDKKFHYSPYHQNQALLFDLNIYTPSEVRTFPLTLKIKDLSAFDSWLINMNLFYYPGYDPTKVTYRWSQGDMEFSGPVKLALPYRQNYYHVLNRFEVQNLPKELVKRARMVELVLRP
jgi:hypothetical protein